MFELLALIILMFILLALLRRYTGTRGYRKSLTDLYVAAKIRKLSAEDNLDISAEYESFKAWVKKKRIENQSLDDTIEEELQHRINKKKINKDKLAPSK